MNKIISQKVVKKPWSQSDIRRNEVFIQMINENFRKQLFGEAPVSSVNAEKLAQVKSSLANHGLWRISKVMI